MMRLLALSLCAILLTSPAGAQNSGQAMWKLERAAGRLAKLAKGCVAERRVVAIAVRGFSNDDDQIDRSQAQWLEEKLQQFMGNEDAIRLVELKGVRDSIDVIRELHGEGTKKSREATKKAGNLKFDLVLFAKAQRLASNTFAIVLTLRSLDNKCSKTYQIESMFVPSGVRYAKPKRVMEAAARKFMAEFDAAQTGLRQISIMPTKYNGRTINRHCGRPLEAEFETAMQVAIADADAAIGTEKQVVVHRYEGDTVGLGTAAKGVWRAQISIRTLSRGARMKILFATPGRSAVPHEQHIALSDLPPCEAVAKGVASITPLQPRFIVGKHKFGFDVNVKRASQLYCLMVSQGDGEGLLLYPRYRTVPEDNWFTPQARPYRFPGKQKRFDWKDNFVLDKPSRDFVHCFATSKNLPQPLARLWRSNTVIARHRRKLSVNLDAPTTQKLLSALRKLRPDVSESMAEVVISRE